jgi:hypothetical protein
MSEPPWGDPFPERTAARERRIEEYDRRRTLSDMVETVSLDLLKTGVVVPLGIPHVMEADAQMVKSILSDSLLQGAIRLQGFVLTETLAPEYESKSVEFPDSPFQHWKHKHADSWWLRRFVRRWPVRNRQVSLIVECERWRVFPHSKIRLPNRDFGKPVLITQTTSRLEWMNDAEGN